MNIEYARQQLIFLFLKDKRRAYIIIGIITFTAVCSAVINGVHNKKIRSLLIRKEAEAKKSSLLSMINFSEKTIKSYSEAFRSRDVFLVMSAVGDIASSSGVKLSSIKPGRQEEKPLYTRYYFDLAIEAGSYNAIGKFVSGIESSQDTYFIDELEIRTREDGAPSVTKEGSQEIKPANKFTANMVLSIVIFKR